MEHGYLYQKQFKKMNSLLVGVFFSLPWTAALAEPLWVIVPASGNNYTQTVPQNRTATVQYVVQNQSSKFKKLIIQFIPGITQTTPCQLAPKGQPGSSCVLTLAINGSALPQGGIYGGPVLCQANPDGSPNANQCYQPSRANSLYIIRGPAIGATITVSPSALNFAEGSSGSLTVTNSVTSTEVATNVTAIIPAGSNISVQGSTCGASLAIGANCTISFASSIQEGPTVISITGDNTNTVNVNVTVTSQPQISITGPVQQNRVVSVSGMTPLSLEVANNAGSAVNANAVTVSNKAACPDLFVNDSDCMSVAPGNSCTLELTSTTPYVPCIITISGSNTANSPQSLIAFSHLGGLVFAESGGSGKVVINATQGFSSQWTSSFSDIPGATSLNDGIANSNAIMADATCSSDPSNCAAQRCRNISIDWYLPARNELLAVRTVLCSNGSIPCNFGEFVNSVYWSSSQSSTPGAFGMNFSTGIFGPYFKGSSFPVRCIRTF